MYGHSYTTSFEYNSGYSEGEVNVYALLIFL